MIQNFFLFYLINCKAGLRSFIKGIDYFRLREYLIAAKQINFYFQKTKKEKTTLIDIGCGEETWGLFAAKVFGFEVTVVDVNQKKINLQRKYSQRLNVRSFDAICADGAKLPFFDESFDVVNCFAVLPLLPGEKDIKVMQEIGRILKKSGKALITVGYDTVFREEKDTLTTKGFSRVYDDNALSNRLIKPSGLHLVKKIYFGQPKIDFSRIWYRLPFLVKLCFRSWLLPILSLTFLKEIASPQIGAIHNKKINGVLLILEK
ncbi:MAG: class I SAM-dependent methyltransferase [Candidatus Omnitrophica bacterium]|nr:class I SAM-dependent methyltransferase [Candidatus Omnitrophota bacterium]